MKAVTFGELLLRLSPASRQRFFQSPSLEAVFGGGEANVAVALSLLGVRAGYLTKLPDNDIGRAAIRELNKYGVDTSFISLGSGRMGIYYLEQGAGARASKVIYDREHSSFSKAECSDFDFDRILEGADWFHFSGITAALGGQLPALCKAACIAAKKKGVTVSCDINYRKNLWTEREAAAVMTPLMEWVDVLITNEEHAKMLFGAEGKENAGKTAETLVRAFGLRAAAVTVRESVSADRNHIAAALCDGAVCVFTKKYTVDIVDRVGSGDAFAAGLIYAFSRRFDPEKAVGFALCASVLKHSIPGDFSLCPEEEILRLLNGEGGGRIQR